MSIVHRFGLLLSVVCCACAAEGVWIEGEAAQVTGVTATLEGRGQSEFLSVGKWLQVAMDGEALKTIPESGGILSWKVTTPAGAQQVWARIGYEFVRSPFAWRIDGGAWTESMPDQLTTDLMELATWCEVAWLQLGSATLTAGEHTIELRLTRRVNEKGEAQRVLFAIDAVCISPSFAPNGRFKPGEDWRDERDRQAATTVFTVPAPAADGVRTVLPLKGLWQIARDDEQLPGPDVAQPIAALPVAPYWRAIEVPSDKNVARPDLLMAHRVWYRATIEVPAADVGRSFHLVFPQNNLNTTVWVNGQLCGFDKNPFARVQIDVSKAMKPGRNDVMVGIRDAWYGYSTNPKDPMKLRKKFNLPESFSHQGFQDLAYPIWGHFQSGILATPSLVVGGSVYVADAFIQPSVAKKALTVEVTVTNPGAAMTGELRWQAIGTDGSVAKEFAPLPLTLAAGETTAKQLTATWPEAKLWWPDEPNLYRLRTSIMVNGKPADVTETAFGFREWTINGKDFVLNGVPWHGWADCFVSSSPEQWLKTFQATNQKMMRFWGTSWQGMPPEEALAFFDAHGVPVRRSNTFDGEAIGYNAVEHDPDLKADGEIKMDLMRNWRDQVVAQVKGERNHPSVFIWSIENEWLYINCINLHGGLMDQFEAEVAKTAAAVKKVDPTRPSMNDGGGAHKNNAMEVAGDHYVYGGAAQYPALAYETNAQGGGRGRWLWDEKRPRFLGEDFFANGINPFDYAYFGGEEAFQGKAATRRAAGIMFRMLTEGYRWAGYGAWHFWMSQNEAVDQYGSNAPVAVFCKQWNWTFAPGQTVVRSLKVFNDTHHADPVVVAWTLTLDGKEIAKNSQTLAVPPGGAQELSATLVMPTTVKDRAEGEWTLTCSHRGTLVFRDVKAISVLATPLPAALLAKTATDAICVFDPQGDLAKGIAALKINATVVASLDQVPEANRVLVLGKNALSETTCGDPRLRAWAAAGRSVIVLEQRQPLRFAGLGAAMDVQHNVGRTAFMENATHPAFNGIQQKDFFTWGDEQIVYRDAYNKPTAGATSLVQCHERLACSALAEVPAGKGILVVCQLPVAEHLSDNPVARRLLVNLLNYGLSYKQEIRAVAMSVTAGGPLATVLAETQVQATVVADPLTALEKGTLVVIEATPANLATLAKAAKQVTAFTKAGGWLVLSGLTPEGLSDFNTVVGVDHLIRPFRAERVSFPASRHWLTAGLTTGDVVMQSGKRVNTFSSDVYLASDVFSYVVDYDDIAPFATFPDPKYFGYTDGGNNDHNPLNMVNGFVSSDGWQMIFSIPLMNGAPHRFDLSWPRAEQITELEWTGNGFYHKISQVRLIPDGAEAAAAVIDTVPNNETQTFAVSLKPAKTLTIDLAKWQVEGRVDVIGVDNLRLKAKRSAEFYAQVKPLLNIGALMAYERGAGGIVLCNVLFQANEPVPENKVKKRAILTALLRNLKAPFGGAQSVIAGAGLTYAPIDLGKQATAYRNQQGWFGDKAFTFADLPTGRQQFAGVAFQIYDFPTSPVPTAVMLGGNGVPGNLPNEVKGIPVNSKLNALFFLHTARLDQRRNEHERRDGKIYEMAKYVIHYADGQVAEVPIAAEIDIDDFKVKQPLPLPGATLAWTKPYDGTDFHAAAYTKQWDNPRPEVAIQSVDLVYGKDRRGVPVLLALTAATVAK